MTNEERIANSKEKIFQAALHEFTRNGYSGSSINNITKAGIPKGLLYHIYKSKDEVYLACVKRCYDQILTALSQGESTLEAYMKRRRRFFAENPEVAKIFFETMYPVSPSVDAQIAEIKKPFDAFNQSFFHHLLDTLPLRNGVSNETAMNYFMLLQNAMNSYFVANDPGAWIKREDALPEIIDLLLYGIVDKNQ